MEEYTPQNSTGMNNKQQSSNRWSWYRRNGKTQVKDLVVDSPVNGLELFVVRRYPRRQIVSESYTGPIAAAAGRDETGIVGLVLWGEDVDKISPGDVIRVQNGWCRSRNGQLVVSSGRYGRLLLIEA
ncbi:MAG TPA: hypothetical protein EYQ53_03720 [Candidatus Poseidoniales archaeon]|jgi:ssDNA-binding replication factor A large subunit|nr:MAG: hypothetical protein CXT69_00985 [Euryarchaeota archaeon]HIG03474.1 hypothetical protein [Candidatus Poseidoniales archaeon]HIK78948.1 hypothetical protein [Candidatus Poseidoniales archaeon]